MHQRGSGINTMAMWPRWKQYTSILIYISGIRSASHAQQIEAPHQLMLNSHYNHRQMTTKDGKLVYTRKWSKRSKRWVDVPVPVPKTYPYAADFISKSLYRWHMDTDRVSSRGVGSTS